VWFTAEHDPKSIMQYPVSNELTTGDFEIGWNTELSEMDKNFIAEMYPKEEDGGGAEEQGGLPLWLRKLLDWIRGWFSAST
jgi:hypothetical protein